MRLRNDARRFETGTYALPQAWTAAGGLSIIEEVGVENIRAHNQNLTRRIISLADDAELDVLSPREDERRSGLVRVRVPGGRQEAERVLHELFERHVVLDSRIDTLRISPHFFNTEDEIDHCFSELRSALSHT